MTSRPVPLDLSGVPAATTLHLPVDEPIGSVVFFHGRGGAQKRHLPAAEQLARNGIACLTFDFRGCGQTAGEQSELTLGDWLDDARAGFDRLVELPECPPPYGCYGSSFGAYLAARVSDDRPVDSLVLRVPSAYPPEYLTSPQVAVDKNPDDIWDYRSTDRVLSDPAIAAMTAFRGDVLIVGAGQDDEVPPRTLEAYAAAGQGARTHRLVWLQDATHNMAEPTSQATFVPMLCEWFREAFEARDSA